MMIRIDDDNLNIENDQVNWVVWLACRTYLNDVEVEEHEKTWVFQSC